MCESELRSEPARSQQARFQTTDWTALLEAADSNLPGFENSLADLLDGYWYPIYAYIRRTGVDPATCEDLTQGFFEHLLIKRVHKHANPERGRFRSFLLTVLKRYLAAKHRERTRVKRGGGKVHVSLDFHEAEHRYSDEPVNDLTPDRLYDREWAYALLGKVLAILREEYVEMGIEDRFDALSQSLMDPGNSPRYAELAEQFQLSESGVKTAAQRLRKRFKTIYREEIQNLVTNPLQVDEEIDHLMASLG